MILCGGLGSRLHEETEFRPKPMLEIGGRPILWHIMKLYASFGWTRFVLCLGYKGQVIREFFLNYRSHQSDMTLTLGDGKPPVYHGNPPEENWEVTLVETGLNTQTGGRVGRGGSYLQEETFCLTYGDGLGDIDLAALLAFHRRHGKTATVTGVRPPGRFGEMEMSADGRVVQFNEKPQTTQGMINGGFFVFNRRFLTDYIRPDADLVLEREPLQRLAQDGELMVYPHTGFWQPMDTYREYKLLNDLWDSGRAPWKRWR